MHADDRMATREIVIANQHPHLRCPSAAVKRAIATLDAQAVEIAGAAFPPPAGELSIVFMRDEALAALHGRFLDDPSSTDVITFEGNPALGVAGEVCVSADTAATYAREHQRDFRAELTLYLVHGWLHLAGHDDLQPAKKRAMRRAEARAMRALTAARAVPDFSLQTPRRR
jgi:probable rRNA maturation factor